MLSVGVAIDNEPLSRLLVKVSNGPNPTNWTEGMVTLDSGASVSIISQNFTGLSDIMVDKILHNLQLFNASGQQMTVNGVIFCLLSLTNGQYTKLGAVVVNPDLVAEQFLLCTSDMVKLQLLPISLAISTEV